MSDRRVLMLEDDEERVDRFRMVLSEIDPDLYTESDIDPGDGLDVAKFLAEQPASCPVIIHTTNSKTRRVYDGCTGN